MGFQEILDWDYLPYAVAVLAVAASTPGVLKIKASLDRKKKRDAYPADTVILHQIGRGPWAPSLSPFPLKLETYLRFAKIPYQNEHAFKFSSKGKIPWITYNGEDVADSQFIIELLNEKRGIDLNSHLSEEEKAIARAFQKMTEENLFWTGVLQRWLYDKNPRASVERFLPFPKALSLRTIIRMIDGQARAHGIGRHSQEEVMAIAKEDMKALSTYLGKKAFIMGDQPSEVDCAIFGLLAQFKWHLPGSPHEQWIKEDFSNLDRHCERMKKRFWPDWDECITHGDTRDASK